MLWVLSECYLSALWVLSDSSLTAHWLLTYSWLIAWRNEPEWWRLRALDKLGPNRRTNERTDGDCDSLSSCWSQKTFVHLAYKLCTCKIVSLLLYLIILVVCWGVVKSNICVILCYVVTYRIHSGLGHEICYKWSPLFFSSIYFVEALKHNLVV